MAIDKWEHPPATNVTVAISITTGLRCWLTTDTVRPPAGTAAQPVWAAVAADYGPGDETATPDTRFSAARLQPPSLHA